MPPLPDLRNELTAVAVEIGDWEKTLHEAHERVRRCWDAALVVISQEAPMLLTANGALSLGPCATDDLYDAMTCFRYLLVDGRMFADLSHTVPSLARLAHLNGSHIVLLVPASELKDLAEALDCEPATSTTLH